MLGPLLYYRVSQAHRLNLGHVRDASSRGYKGVAVLGLDPVRPYALLALAFPLGLEPFYLLLWVLDSV
jgi:hypothetical protein